MRLSQETGGKRTLKRAVDEPPENRPIRYTPLARELFVLGTAQTSKPAMVSNHHQTHQL